MVDRPEDQFGLLRERLQRLPFALSVSDMDQPDHPLIFVNDAFKHMTGYGDEMLGLNCRFLQGDLENDRARAEIRNALETDRRVQVVLHNRRKNGEEFYNMLLLERLQSPEMGVSIAVGSQFDLGAEIDDTPQDSSTSGVASRARQNAVAISLERRRVMADAAIRMIKSWFILNAVTDQS